MPSDNFLRGEVRSVLTAMQYFTRLPAPTWIGHEPGQLNRAARYFPAIGILIGGVAALVCYTAAIVWPAMLAVVLSVVATVWMTGAFHEDGLADTFDGLGGGTTRERALEIMKDSRLGTYGTVALILVLALKVVALSALPIPIACAAAIGAHALSRWCALIVIGSRDYVRDAAQSRAKPVVDRIGVADQSRGRSHLLIGAVFGLTPTCVAAGYVTQWSSSAWGWIAITLLSALGMTMFLMRWFTRRLGGYTGDTLGATQQLTEVTCYLAWVAVWNWY